jgi:hypothetical protein
MKLIRIVVAGPDVMRRSHISLLQASRDSPACPTYADDAAQDLRVTGAIVVATRNGQPVTLCQRRIEQVEGKYRLI